MVTEARFPSLDAGAAHYESFYLKACHPAQPLGVWIRYTVHKRPGHGPRGSLWFTLFDAAADGPRASKVTVDGPTAPQDAYIEIAGSRFGPDGAIGEAVSDQLAASWDLKLTGSEEPLRHLPDWAYGAKLPRTKLLSPHPNARFSGRLVIEREGTSGELSVDGWRGMVGHNWGAEHAHRAIWLHGLAFDDEPEAWMDVGLGRVKLGPAVTPWIASGALSLEGERYRLGGMERVRATKVDERHTDCDFVLPGKGVTVRGHVEAPAKDFVGWVYSDPDGPDHRTVNCSIADMTLTVSRKGRPDRELRVSGGAAYELQMHETPDEVPIQPFPDG